MFGFVKGRQPLSPGQAQLDQRSESYLSGLMNSTPFGGTSPDTTIRFRDHHAGVDERAQVSVRISEIDAILVRAEM